MFENFKKSCLILALASALTYSYASETQSPNRHQGVYLGGALGMVITSNFPNDTAKRTGGLLGFGLAGMLGYMFNPWVGLEGGITGVAAMDWTTPFSQNIDMSNVSSFWYWAAVKGVCPFGSYFSVFAKAGVGGIHYSFKTTNIQTNVSSNFNADEPGGFLGLGFGASFNQYSEVTLELDGLVTPSIGYNNNDAIVERYSGTTLALQLLLGYVYHF